VTSVADLSCQELVELVTDYLEGALPGAERERFEAHLEECPDCGEYVAQMRATIVAVAVGQRELGDEPEVAGLLRVFRDWKRGSNGTV
jgi:anti-sigma factor RsiW